MTGFPWAFFVPYFAFRATLSLAVGWWEMQGRAAVCGLFWIEFLWKVVFCGEGLNVAYGGPFQVCGQICLHWCLWGFSVISVRATIQALIFFFPHWSL